MTTEPAQSAQADASARDSGFTLIEVVWALFLLGLVAMGSLALFLHGKTSIAHMQRQQAAVAVANSAMDSARSVSPKAVNALGTSGLVKGRSTTAVKAVWDAATAANSADTSDMVMVSDPATSLVTSDQWVPVQSAAVVDHQPYTIDTLIGLCYRLRAASTTNEDCVATKPAAGTYVETYRVRVVVRWNEGVGTSRAYTYRLSTLVDPSKDATWNTSLKPFAYDDEFSVEVGSSASFHAIVANDTVDYATSTNPVKLTVPSDMNPSGAGTITTKSGDNNGIYFAPSSKSGAVTFGYKVQGSSGETSADPATVTVHIVPKPDDDNIYVAAGTTTDITADMLDGDLGTTNLDPANRVTTIVPVFSSAVDMFSTENVTDEMNDARTQDAHDLADAGVSVDSNGKVKFTASSTAGTTTFYYYLVDDPKSTGQRYPSITVGKVKVTSESAPEATDFSEEYAATSSDKSNIIDEWIGSNPTGTTIKVTDVKGPASGRVKVGTSTTIPATGTSLTFITNGTIGNYTITYQTVSPGGKATSSLHTITVRVNPVAPKTLSFTKKTISTSVREYTVNPNPSGTANDFLPNSGVGLTGLAFVSGNCSAVVPDAVNPLVFDVTFTKTTGYPTPSCTLTFNVISTGTSTYLTPALVSVDTYTWVVNP